MKIIQYITVLMLIVWVPILPLSAQDMFEFREYEDSLFSLSEQVFSCKTEQLRNKANDLMLETFEDALSLNNSFKYPFDSLDKVSIIVSSDNQVRLITWMVRKDDGTYEYFGFVQSYSQKKDDYAVYTLHDHTNTIESPDLKVLDHKNWYGAVYYEIITSKSGRRKFYTLLGWKGNNILTTKRIIEVLTIRSNGMPKFGYSLFRYDEYRRSKRIIYEYSAQSVMLLSYDEQNYVVRKKRLFSSADPNKRPGWIKRTWRNLFNKKSFRAPSSSNKKDQYKYIQKKDHMIVMDRLEPSNETLRGQYQFYYPETNIIDGLVFQKGYWRLIKDINARNPKNKLDDPKNRPKVERKLAPGK